MFYMVFLATAGHLKRKIKGTLLVAEAGSSCLLCHSGVHTPFSEARDVCRSCLCLDELLGKDASLSGCWLAELESGDNNTYPLVPSPPRGVV